VTDQKSLAAEHAQRSLPACIPIARSNNPAIRRIRRLQLRKERERTGTFFVEGVRLVLAAVEQAAELETLVLAPELLDSPLRSGAVLSRLPAGVRRMSVTPDLLRSVAHRDDVQGVGAVVRQRFSLLAEAQPRPASRWLALDGIQYPGNLGTILRACDAAGCAGVVLIGSSADPFDPIAVRASMGAIFFQRIFRASFPEFAAWCARHRVAIIGASPEAGVHYRQAEYPTPGALLLGSEAKGLPPEFLARCAAVVRIPMGGACDSLNVAMAATVLMYEMAARAAER